MSEPSRNSSRNNSTTNPQETRRPRKPRTKKTKSKPVTPNENDEASPSINLNLPGPSTSPLKPASSATFEHNDDFVAFTFSDDEEEKEDDIPIREWDKDKRPSEDTHGKKRKADDVEREDRYSSRRRTRLENVPRKAPWVVDVDWQSCNNVPELLHREVEAFVKYVSPTPEEDEVRSYIVALISKAVAKNFPDAKVMPFGSFETKLYLPTGDIDLVIDSDSMAYSDKVTVLRALANTMKRAGITDNVSIIAKAKVPIIKFITTHGRFPVDISINQTNGIAAGKMVNRFIGEFPVLRALVLIIKAFLSQRGMNEVFSGGLGSYSIVCLAVSFLQMHPKIRRGEIDPSKNMGVLVMEFFELYGCFFNYHEVGISIREGGSYFNKAQRGWLDYNRSHLLSIEDPGDPSNDVSKGTYGIAKVRTTFAGAHGILTSTAFLHAGLISSRREGRYTSFRKQVEPEDMSILSSVLGITQETINHRQLVQEVYQTGVLHQLMGVPKPVEPPRTNVSTTTKRPAEGSTTPKWDAGLDYSSDREEIDYRRRRRDEDDEEEESRYTRQPPRKRRRVGAEADYHAVYTTDSDEEEGAIHEDPHVSERRGYDLVGSDGESLPTKKPRSKGNSNRRDYWLAKGGN